MGADKLLGNGDMLFLWPGFSTLIRGQGTYLSDDEINRVIESVATSEPQYVKELVQLKAAEPGAEGANRWTTRTSSIPRQWSWWFARAAGAAPCCSGRWGSAMAAPPD